MPVPTKLSTAATTAKIPFPAIQSRRATTVQHSYPCPRATIEGVLRGRCRWFPVRRCPRAITALDGTESTRLMVPSLVLFD